MIVISAQSRQLINQTELHGYHFYWNGDVAIALGFGSLYNHSDEPNATYERRTEERTLVVRAIRPIEPDEEVTIDYRGDPETKLWFEPED